MNKSEDWAGTDIICILDCISNNLDCYYFVISSYFQDEGNQRHYIPPSADLTEEPFYPPNPMGKKEIF